MSDIYRTIILEMFFFCFVFYSLFVENLWKPIKTTNNLNYKSKNAKCIHGRNLGDGYTASAERSAGASFLYKCHN